MILNVFFSHSEREGGKGNRGKGRKEEECDGVQRKISLSALKEKDGYLTEIEIDEMSCFVRHIATEITSYDTMPRRIVLLVELFLDKCRDILQKKANTSLH